MTETRETRGPTQHKERKGHFVGAYFPTELAAWLKREARANFRTVSGQLEFLLTGARDRDPRAQQTSVPQESATEDSEDKDSERN